eukprot:2927183-Pleurochrysis_carterae.AAC.1
MRECMRASCVRARARGSVCCVACVRACAGRRTRTRGKRAFGCVHALMLIRRRPRSVKRSRPRRLAVSIAKHKVNVKQEHGRRVVDDLATHHGGRGKQSKWLNRGQAQHELASARRFKGRRLRRRGGRKEGGRKGKSQSERKYKQQIRAMVSSLAAEAEAAAHLPLELLQPVLRANDLIALAVDALLHLHGKRGRERGAEVGGVEARKVERSRPSEQAKVT